MPAGMVATKLLGGILWWGASLQAEISRNTQFPLSSRFPLAQPRAWLLLEPFCAVPYPQNFTFGWKCPRFVSAELLVAGGLSPHAAQRDPGSSAGLAVAQEARAEC